MQFKKNTSSGKINQVSLLVKFILGLAVILGVFFLINKIDFHTQNKEIEKVIPNENFKIVK